MTHFGSSTILLQANVSICLTWWFARRSQPLKSVQVQLFCKYFEAADHCIVNSQLFYGTAFLFSSLLQALHLVDHRLYRHNESCRKAFGYSLREKMGISQIDYREDLSRRESYP